MDYDELCHVCDGTGERDFISGSRCLYCDGKGWLSEPDEPDDYGDEPEERTDENEANH